MTRVASLRVAVLVAAAGALTYASRGAAQRASSGHVLTVALGSPGSTATDLGDARRTSSSRDELPLDGLRIVWSRHLRARTRPPLVTRDGTVVAIGDRAASAGGPLIGELEMLNADGTDQARVSTGPGPTSAPAVLADGTIVVLDAAGDLVGVRDGAVTYRAHVASPSAPPEENGPRGITVFSGRPRGRPHRFGVAPPVAVAAAEATSVLPLADGGVAVAFDSDLVSLDADGGVRARAMAPLPPSTPLVATDGGVAFATASGRVYEWNLRTAIDAVAERGGFGVPPPAVLVGEDGRHLLAVVRGARLVVLDLGTGAETTRASSGANLFANAVSLGATADGPVAFLESVTPSGSSLVEVEHDGHVTPFAIPLTSGGGASVADGGYAIAVAPAESFLLSDRSGRVAFATGDGHVGVATRTTKAELGSFPCGAPAPAPPNPFGVRVPPRSGVVGLVAAGPHAFLVACETGDVALVRGD